MKRINYYNLKGFENVYLEDSYVLDIESDEHSVRILLEAVLTEEHPQYTSPLPNEQYCYRKARIVFKDAEKVIWTRKNMRRYTDATGEVDYGNIDTFFSDEGRYHLAGAWGELDIIDSELTFKLIDG